MDCEINRTRHRWSGKLQKGWCDQRLTPMVVRVRNCDRFTQREKKRKEVEKANLRGNGEGEEKEREEEKGVKTESGGEEGIRKLEKKRSMVTHKKQAGWRQDGGRGMNG